MLDAEDVERDKWVVSAEGKGIDWVLEAHVGGDRKKDAETKLTRYAQLGIPEYFLYDRARQRLSAFQLAPPDARMYTPIVPQHAMYRSNVLGQDVQVEKERLRFFHGTSMLLESEELIARLEQMLDQVEQRAEEEAKLRREAEDALAEALEEIARLKARSK